MRFVSLKFLIGLCIVLAGCQSSKSAAVLAISEDVAKASYVGDIVVVMDAANAPEGFAEMLTASLREKVDKCATGSEPVRLEAYIAHYTGPSPGNALLSGHGARLRGAARVYSARGTLIGDYDIAQTIGGAGLIGAAVMASGVDQDLVNNFARDVCRKLFFPAAN